MKHKRITKIALMILSLQLFLPSRLTAATENDVYLRAKENVLGMNEYDPECDFNEDGNTDVFDIVRIKQEILSIEDRLNKVESDITSQTESIEDLQNDLCDSLTCLYDGSIDYTPTLINGESVNTTSGAFVANKAYIRTDLIKLPLFADKLYTDFKTTSASNGLAFYDESKTFIADSGTRITKEGTKAIDIPRDAKYFAVCNNSGDVKQKRISVSISKNTISDIIETENIDEEGNRNTRLIDYSGEVTFKPEYYDGGVNSSTGEFDPLYASSYYRTDYIAIPSNCSGLLTNLKIGSSTAMGYAFYDKDKNYLCGGKNTAKDDVDKIVTLIHNIREDARYIVISSAKSLVEPDDFYITFTGSIYSLPQVSIQALAESQIYNSENDVIINPAFVNGNMRITDGTVYDGSIHYARTSFIKIPKNAIKIETNLYAHSNNFGLGFFNEDKEYISGVTLLSETNICDIPQSAVYMLACDSSFNYDGKYIKFLMHSDKFKGKKLSIIGDSISTFSGYIPNGYKAYYPTGDVQSIENTWWKKVINATGMELLKNCSWSASTICAESQESLDTAKPACSDARIADLSDGNINPDVIMIYIGTNDWGRSYQLGDYDSTKEVPAYSKELKISEAYALMLYKIRNAYPNAEIYCITNFEGRTLADDTSFPVLNLNGNSIHEVNHIITEVAHIYGAKVIDLETCGIHYWNVFNYTVDGDSTHAADHNIHPNDKGHSMIAESIISQLY